MRWSLKYRGLHILCWMSYCVCLADGYWFNFVRRACRTSDPDRFVGHAKGIRGIAPNLTLSLTAFAQTINWLASVFTFLGMKSRKNLANSILPAVDNFVAVLREYRHEISALF